MLNYCHSPKKSIYNQRELNLLLETFYKGINLIRIVKYEFKDHEYF